MKRGQIWWVDLGSPNGSEPAYRRPVVIISGDDFNQSRLSTVLVASITSNLTRKEAPGNVFLNRTQSGLTKDSVINVSQLTTVDKDELDELVSVLPRIKLQEVDEGLRLVLGLT